MTLREFVEAMAVLCLAINKPMPPEQAKAYHSLLSDIPVDILRLAVQRTLLEHAISTIPTIAEIRKIAAEIQHGPQRTAAEAFSLARKAIGSFGYLQKAKGLASLPPDVADVMRHLWESWCLQAWDRQAEVTRRDRLLPGPLRTAIAAKQDEARGIIQGVAARLGIPE
jgi:hypothetical protein